MSDDPGDARSPASPVRVALLVGQGTMRHVGKVVQHLTVGLLDEPIYVTVVAPPTEDVSNLPSPPVEIILHREVRTVFLRRRAIDALSAQLAEHDVEILHALDASAEPLARRLSAREGWPYVVSVLGLPPAQAISPVPSQCRAVLAASLSIRAHLLARRVAPPEKVHLLRLGIHQLRKVSAFSQPGQSISIIAAGELGRYEAFAPVLESFAALREAGYDCAFFILGVGRAERALRARAEALRLMHHLTFVSQVPQGQLAEILQSADLLIYPQSSGVLEMEVLEAMAAGIPVLVGGPCVGDFVIDLETAISYDVGNRDDLCDKLQKVLDDPPTGIRTAENALAYLRENHSPARMVAALAECYRQEALTGRTLKIG